MKTHENPVFLAHFSKRFTTPAPLGSAKDLMGQAVSKPKGKMATKAPAALSTSFSDRAAGPFEAVNHMKISAKRPIGSYLCDV